MFACSGFSQSPFYFWSALRKDEIFGPESQGLYLLGQDIEVPVPEAFRISQKVSAVRILNASQARNQDFMWGGANEAKADPTTEMYFLSSDPFI